MSLNGVSLSTSNNPPLIPVSRSSSVRAFHYDEDSKALKIQYSNGSLYQFDDVPVSLVEYVFNEAPRIGLALRKRIRGYEFRKLDPAGQ